jgi:ERCC4-related helicase
MKTKKADVKAFDDMQALSKELGDNKGLLYKHDQYQATIAACIVTLDDKFTLVTVPTGSGKTFIIGLLFHYYKHEKAKSVIVVVPS